MHDPPAVAHRREVRRVHADAAAAGGRPAAAAAAGDRRRRAGAGQYLLPVDADVQAGRHRPAQQHHCACPSASAWRSSSTSSAPASPAAARSSTRTIRRANPALRETDKVLEILAEQNQVARRARRATPTRSSRRSPATASSVADFIAAGQRRLAGDRRAPRATSSGTSSGCRASCAELRPTMARLGALRRRDRRRCSTDLGAAAPDINRFIRELGPVREAAHPGARRRSATPPTSAGPALVRRKPIVERPADASPARPSRCRSNLDGAREPAARHRRHRAPDGLPLLPGGRDQRLRRRSATTCAPA